MKEEDIKQKVEEIKEIRDRINKIKWWHTINLGKDYGYTNGKQGSIMRYLHMPPDFTNKIVLDIGAVDGMYSFEAEARNAKRILAVDSYAWQNKQYSSYKDLKTGKDGFNLARKIIGSNVEDLELNDFDEEITAEKLGKWDVVLCLGILYHMKYPFKFIKNLYDITNEFLLLETHTDVNNTYGWAATGVPMMAFYPGNELNEDETNWWGPNMACIKAMLKVVGFKKVELVYISGARRCVFHAYKNEEVYNKYEKKNSL